MPTNKIAVFTCITNRYDDIPEPQYIDKDIDYFMISETPPPSTSTFRWIDIKNAVPESIIDDKDRNRYCKMHGAEIFKDYRYSIYLDGNMLIKGKISNWINKISDCGLALFAHPSRENIFEEGLKLYSIGQYNNEKIIGQISKYLEEGMPLATGLFQCGVIVRDNPNHIATQLMHEWFYEYMNGVKRDQLSFSYVLWRQGINYNDIGKLGNNIHNSNEIKWLMTHKLKG